MRWTAGLALCTLTIGCSLDTSSAGSGVGSESGESSGTTAADPTTGPSVTTSDDTEGSTAAATTDPSPGTTSEDTTAGEPTGESTTGEPSCPPETAVSWASDGVVEAPMELVDSPLLGREVARSWSLGLGTLTLELETTCDGPVYLWALVWDFVAGNGEVNPDSYFVSIDGEEEFVWEYGCATEGTDDQTWHWLELEVWTETACDHDPLGLELTAGTHTIVFRNREPGVATDVAAIAGVVLSHDPNADPAQFLDPDAPPR